MNRIRDWRRWLGGDDGKAADRASRRRRDGRGTFPAAVEAARPASPRGRRPSARSRPAIEAMEGRTLLSAAPIPTYQTIQVANGSNPMVALAPMQNTIADGTLESSSYRDSVQVQLQAGEIFAASVDVTADYTILGLPPLSISGSVSSLSVRGPNGATIASQSTTGGNSAVNPLTDQATNDSSVSFTAPTTGTYTLTVGTDAAKLTPHSPLSVVTLDGVDYALKMRPIELDTQTLAPSGSASDSSLVSNADGGLYAWIGAGGTELTLSGPTGIGFQLGGQWKAVTSGPASWSTTNYVDTGPLSLSLLGQTITLPQLPGTEFVVQTQANGYDGAFGQVSTIETKPVGNGAHPGTMTTGAFEVPGGALSSLLSVPMYTLGGIYLTFPGGAPSLPNLQFGIDVGNSAGAESTGLPLDPAVPYIYFTASMPIGLDYGYSVIKAGSTSKIGAALDPTDPTIGLHVQNGGQSEDLAVEFSRNAMIPFTPMVASVEFTRTLYGDIYYSDPDYHLPFNLLTGHFVPMAVITDITINVDSHHQGLTNAMSLGFSELLAGGLGRSQAAAYLESCSFGTDGEVWLPKMVAGGFSWTTPAFQGTLIHPDSNSDGNLYHVAGNSVDALGRTALASLSDSDTSLFQGTFNMSTGAFSFVATEKLQLSPLPREGTIDISSAKGLEVWCSDSASFSDTVSGIQVSLDILYDDFEAWINTSGDAGFSDFIGLTVTVDGQSQSQPFKCSKPSLSLSNLGGQVLYGVSNMWDQALGSLLTPLMQEAGDSSFNIGDLLGQNTFSFL